MSLLDHSQMSLFLLQHIDLLPAKLQLLTDLLHFCYLPIILHSDPFNGLFVVNLM